MINRLCAPEMSFNTGEKEPHAYVAYMDGEKESVPLSYIYMFPPKWRDEGWDVNYLFKVFWSPDEKETPTRYLKHSPEIPVYDKGSTMEQAGYYRAAVVKVKESRAELEEDLDTKRASVGCLKYKYTSFDQRKTSNEKEQQELKRKANASKLARSKKNESKVKTKTRKGLNVPAQLHNTTDLKSDLVSRFPKLLDTTSADESGDSDMPSKTRNTEYKCAAQQADKKEDTRLLSMSALVQPNHKPIPDVSTVPDKTNSIPDKNSTASSDESSDHLHKEPGRESEGFNGKKDKMKPETPRGPFLNSMKTTTSKRSNSDSRKKRSVSTKKQRRLFDETTSPSSDSDGHGKRFKYDVDFTPRKYAVLEEEVKIKQTTIQRLSNLNLKLQEDIIKLENKILDLEHAMEELKAGKSESTLLKQAQRVQKPKPAAAIRQLDFEEPGTAELSLDDLDPFSMCEAQIDNSCPSDKGNLLDTAAAPSLDKEVEVDEENNNELKGTKDAVQSDSDEKPEVKIPDCAREAIFSIPAGEKRDLRFIKDLSTAAFGPEVLASSTILGSLKGGNKRVLGAAPKVKKPALDKATLQFVKDQLIKRVEKEEKVEIKEPEKHPRTAKKRIHDAIFDCQKKLRSRGYGVGVKSNTVVKELFDK